jgi:N-methylhydantoinase A/oxoprolinase/acetone carboxylase beta subunit
MVKRLKDQLKVQKKVAEFHGSRRKLDELDFYPAHDERKETPEYVKAHKHMTVELDLPCIVCGIKRTTLDGGKNRYGSKAMETHHHVIEWALANAIDVDKFNKAILPNLRHKHPDRREYSQPFTQKQVADWVDHSEDNLWVVCDVHHRAKFLGIHEITFPIWGPMDLLRDDFEEYVNTEVKRAAEEAKANKAAAKAAGKKPAASAPATAPTTNGNGHGNGKHAAGKPAAKAKPGKAHSGPKMPPPPKKGVKPRPAARA